jgi:hypothetical protein
MLTEWLDRGKRIEESMLEGKRCTAHLEINSWGKMQSFKKENVRSIEIRKNTDFWIRFYKLILIKWQI